MEPFHGGSLFNLLQHSSIFPLTLEACVLGAISIPNSWTKFAQPIPRSATGLTGLALHGGRPADGIFQTFILLLHNICMHCRVIHIPGARRCRYHSPQTIPLNTLSHLPKSPHSPRHCLSKDTSTTMVIPWHVWKPLGKHLERFLSARSRPNILCYVIIDALPQQADGHTSGPNKVP